MYQVLSITTVPEPLSAGFRIISCHCLLKLAYGLSFSLFQVLGQWGRSKNQAWDEQDLVKKNRRAREGGLLDLPSFSTRPRLSHVAQPHSISPIDREPGTGYLSFCSSKVIMNSVGFTRLTVYLWLYQEKQPLKRCLGLVLCRWEGSKYFCCGKECHVR